MFRTKIKIHLYFHDGIYADTHKTSATKIYSINTDTMQYLMLTKDSLFPKPYRKKYSSLPPQYIFYSIPAKESLKINQKILIYNKVPSINDSTSIYQNY